MLGLEFLHVLDGVVDQAEPGALAPTKVSPEAEKGHGSRV